MHRFTHRRYEEGQSLKSWLDVLGRPPTQDEIDAILALLLDAPCGRSMECSGGFGGSGGFGRTCRWL